MTTALLQDNVTRQSFSSPALTNPQVLALAAKVKYRIDPDQARVRSQGGGNLIKITFANGKVVEQGIDYVYGSPDFPLTEEVLVKKFLDCGAQAATPINKTDLDTLVERILSLEKEKDVGSIMQLT